jgi:Ca2+-binding EF-hand superfamily protein
MQSTFMLMTAAAVFGSGLALAQSAIDSTPEKSQPHYVARFNEQFAAADKDGDRALTKSEAEAGDMQRIAKHFDRLDTDGDGKVTREEMRALIRSKLSS